MGTIARAALLALLATGCHPPPTSAADSDGSAVDSAASSDLAPRPYACTTTLAGTLLGTAPHLVDCVAHVEASGGMVATDVVLVDYPSVCPDVSAGAVHANSHVVDFHFTTNSALTVGTYPAAGGMVSVQYAAFDGACNPSDGESASGGTVTITRADASGIAGTFDVTLDADHVSGRFDAPTCAGSAPDGGASCR